jgi:hypothetical protein
MGANLDSQMKRKKNKILGKIEEMDNRAEIQGLCEEWKGICNLEGELEKVLAYEEQIWQHRCSEQWLLLEDSNSGFFHGIANGRRRKCNIFALEYEGSEISEPKELRLHIKEYYKQLFGREERWEIRLKDVWDDQCHLDERERQKV